MVKEEMEIARMVEEKQEEKEDLIEIRTVEELVSERFHKYLKVFEMKESERMPTRKTWDYAIDLKEVFVPKKEEDISIIKNREREGSGVFEESVEEGVYSTIKVTTDITSILFTEEEWKNENNIRLLIFEQLDN